MVLPDNTRAREDAYEGYGEFGGKDYYEEVSRLNGGDGSRSHGIDIEYGLKPDGGKPILPRFTEDPDAKWEDLKDPENCPKQGYFY